MVQLGQGNLTLLEVSTSNAGSLSVPHPRAAMGTHYGTHPPESEDAAEARLTASLLKRATFLMVALGVVLLGSTLSPPRATWDATSFAVAADGAWSCADFDDDASIVPEECGTVDRSMCSVKCQSPWCETLCGDACAAGEGALCAYRHLADLPATCADVEAAMLASGATIASELAAAAADPAARNTCRPMVGYRLDEPERSERIDPRNAAGYPVCDHHAWCSFCAGSDECEAVVPKARSATRIEDGGCSAAALGRVVSLCDAGGHFSEALPRGQAPASHVRKIFYNNCAAAKDRRALQEAALAKLGVPHERFACVEGDTVADVLDSDRTRRFAAKPLREDRDGEPPSGRTAAHTVGNFLSHYLAFERIAAHADDDPDGLYVFLEDDAVLADGFDASAIDRAAASLPADWAYASLNAHESICEQDRVNEDWYVKRAPDDGSLFGSSRVAAGDCDAASLDGEWHDGRILYLSAAASLLRPATAKRVLDWLDAQPIYHIDAALRTPDAHTFAAYQFRTNLFAISHDVSESRVA